MILLSHPTGNTFMRALLGALLDADQLHSFHTTLNFSDQNLALKLMPPGVRSELLRRSYSTENADVYQYPTLELIRLAAQKFGLSFLTTAEKGIACTDAVYHDLDRQVANFLKSRLARGKQLTGIYAYDDGALCSFIQAAELGLKCFYDLPIAHWQTSKTLLSEEAIRSPEWVHTLDAARDSPEKCERKSRELDLADVIVCPSKFVLDSLPESLRSTKRCIVAEFGSRSPEKITSEHRNARNDGKLKVLFAGSMSQRKGLADLFHAMKLLNSNLIELTVMGSLIAPIEFYRQIFPSFRYEPTRPHAEVIKLMESCDILVLPSLIEGRALVQQEALSCGLPLIVTANAGAEDLIETGKTGFLIPIRSPQAIAEKIMWFAENRSTLEEMREYCRAKAAEHTWSGYTKKILNAILSAD